MIETERLTLFPLTYDLLLMYHRNDHSLETALKVCLGSRIISAELKEALEQTILPNVAMPDQNYLYHTLWTIIHRSEKQLVGDLCMVGAPNAAGEIEIGYGTYEAFRQQGFMKEAVGGIIQWAKSQPGVCSIVASTAKNNVASFMILEKNNFIKVRETEDLFHWQLVFTDKTVQV